jgi:hypothetical protein
MTDHPVTPTPQLRQLWAQQAQRISPYDPVEWMQYVSEKAAQWGADKELEACCRELEYNFMPDSGSLRAARRPKPKSLKEQALQELDKVDILWATEEFGQDTLNSLDILRRALEALPDD